MANKTFNVWLRNSKNGKIRVVKIKAGTLTDAKKKAKRAGTKSDKVMRLAAAATKKKKTVKKAVKKKTTKKKTVKKKKVVKKKTAKKSTKKKPVKRKKTINPKRKVKRIMAKKKKRSAPKRRRRALPAGIGETIQTGLLSAAGAIGGSIVANKVPIKDPRIKAALPLALGIGIGMTKFGRGKMVKPALAGLVTIGSLSLIKQFVPNVPMLAGEDDIMLDYADRDLLGYDDELDEEMLGVSADIGDDDIDDIDDIDEVDLVGDSVEIEGEEFITSADL